MKQTIAALLLLVPLQALGNSIAFELSRAEFPAIEIDPISKSSEDPNSTDEIGTFQLQQPGIPGDAGFCALGQNAGCGIAALMVVVGAVGDASQVGVTTAEPGPVTALGASATRVPVPGALGLFVTGLLVLGAIRRKRRI